MLIAVIHFLCILIYILNNNKDTHFNHPKDTVTGIYITKHNFSGPIFPQCEVGVQRWTEVGVQRWTTFRADDRPITTRSVLVVMGPYWPPLGFTSSHLGVAYNLARYYITNHYNIIVEYCVS